MDLGFNNTAAGHETLGRVLYLTGQTEQAVAHLRRSIGLIPGHAAAYAILGQIYT